MGARLSGADAVYAAADAWVGRALRSDDSLFTPGRRIWTSELLGELHRRFLNRPDESGDTFFEKLERQLNGSPPEVYQLMAEVLYVHFLIVSTTDSTNQEEQLKRILNWSPATVAVPPELVAGLTPGLATPGMAFHTYRPYQVGLIIEFAGQWKRLRAHQRARLLAEPEEFKEFVTRLELHSELLRERPNTPRIQRQALLHLVHPDSFEAIVSADHKARIAAAFSGLLDDPAEDIDRRLQQIRATLERDLGGGTFHFYQPEIRAQWDGGGGADPDPWDAFIAGARAFVDSGGSTWRRPTTRWRSVGDSRGRAGPCFPAPPTGGTSSGGASAGISSSPSSKPGSATGSTRTPTRRSQALSALWADDDVTVSERVRGFRRCCRELPAAVRESGRLSRPSS